MDNIFLYSKLATLPDNMRVEVADFIDYLLSKAQKEEIVKPIPTPKFGSGKGLFKMKNDFDAPLDDFKEYM